MGVRSLGKEHEEADAQEDGNGRAEELSCKLILRLGTQEMTSLEVSGHVGCLSGCTGREGTSDQIHELSLVRTETLT